MGSYKSTANLPILGKQVKPITMVVEATQDDKAIQPSAPGGGGGGPTYPNLASLKELKVLTPPDLNSAMKQPLEHPHALEK